MGEVQKMLGNPSNSITKKIKKDKFIEKAIETLKTFSASDLKPAAFVFFGSNSKIS